MAFNSNVVGNGVRDTLISAWDTKDNGTTYAWWIEISHEPTGGGTAVIVNDGGATKHAMTYDVANNRILLAAPAYMPVPANRQVTQVRVYWNENGTEKLMYSENVGPTNFPYGGDYVITSLIISFTVS
jgi:murein DD-endopeptidase MepM/ murein hydrolase activator NlpD